jgi:hypothetical protein
MGLGAVLERWILEFAARPVEQSFKLVRDLTILGLFFLSAFAIGRVVSGLQLTGASSSPALAECPVQNSQLNIYEYELQRRRCEAIQSGALERLEQR